MTLELFFGLVIAAGVTTVSSRPGDGVGENHGQGEGNNNDGFLTITVSYESQVSCTDDFFHDQLTKEVFLKFAKCSNVKWVFEPCENSHICHGRLNCPDGGEITCKINRMQACVADIYKNQEIKVGLFVTCLNNAKVPVKSGRNCARYAKIDWSSIDQCVRTGKGDQYCDAFHKRIAARKPIYIPSIMFNGKYIDGDDLKIKEDLVKTICDKLQAKHQHCDVCNATTQN